jgi:hypothetical protein
MPEGFRVVENGVVVGRWRPVDDHSRVLKG